MTTNFATLTGSISIHALFAEGDKLADMEYSHTVISIHALFAEGDTERTRQVDH